MKIISKQKEIKLGPFYEKYWVKFKTKQQQDAMKYPRSMENRTIR